MVNKNNILKLREIIRVLERKLDMVQESENTCCGISMSKCHALVEIGRSKLISLNELAGLLGLDKSTVSRTINDLVKSGLINRQIDSQDRRYIVLSLTDTGYKYFIDIEDRMNYYYSKIYETIPDCKKEQVLESINILIASIEKYEYKNNKENN